MGLSYYLPDDTGAKARTGKVARYAWGDDYHKVMKDRLKEYVQGLSRRLGREVRARWYVDDGPMLDRAAAQRAGVGWCGLVWAGLARTPTYLAQVTAPGFSWVRW